MEYAPWIGGKWVATAERRQVRLPYDGSLVAEVCVAGPAEVEAAVAAARDAAVVMREMTAAERAAILHKAYHRLLERSEELALAVSSESGKPIREARLEVERASQTLLFSAEEARRLAGEVVPMEAAPAGKGHWAMTVREPLGVIAAITPFNFPLNLSMHKIAPALAAGNAIVHKPASTTPVTALLLADILRECGLPAGALNVIPGPGGTIGDLLAQHAGVAMVTFTGSPDVGVRIRGLAGMKRVTLELGNNSALIVDEDADVEEAARRAVPGSFANSGQVCISIQRIYVHRRVAAEFTAAFLEGTRALKMGHPHDPATEVSSLISEAEAARVEEWIAEAVAAGARLLWGGERRGAVMRPAVLESVPPHVRLCCREAFGPVVGINVFDTLEEAIEQVNRSDYGLQAGLYTRDIAKAFRAARRLEVGGVMIN
ncbi:MAG: aldehyde dehydrogenase family protein, partial [Bryobacteraceae bacterium]|nr:aldehyde dehydrogenase family protein [Bryobacteraceae bacterium]